MKKLISILLVMVVIAFSLPVNSQAATLFYPDSKMKDNTPSAPSSVYFINEKNQQTKVTNPIQLANILKQYKYSVITLLLNSSITYKKLAESQAENTYYLGTYTQDNSRNAGRVDKTIKYSTGYLDTETTSNSATTVIGADISAKYGPYKASVSASQTNNSSYSRTFQAGKTYGESETFHFPPYTINRVNAYLPAIKKVGTWTFTFKTRNKQTLKIELRNMTQYSPLSKDDINFVVVSTKVKK